MDEFYQDLLEPVVYRWVKTHEHIKVCENQCTLCIDGSNSTGIISFHNEGIVELSVKNKDSDEILFYLHFQMHDFKSTMDQFNTFFNYLCLPTIKLGESIFNNVNTNKILLSCSGGLTTSYFAYSMQEIFKRQGLDIVVDAVGYYLYSGNAQDVTEKLDKGLLDFGILIEPTNFSKYDFIKLPYTDCWGVLMKKDAFLASKEYINPQDLKDLPLICSNQDLVRNELSGWLKDDFDKLNIVATYNLIYNASLLVDEGSGYALTLDKLINTYNSTLCFKPLEPKLEVGLDLVWKKYQIFFKAADFFLKKVIELI